MFRSLYMKLVLIMVLLILSLMMVVGAFLINSVTGFYLNEFYQQMQTVFGDPDFVQDLKTQTEDTPSDVVGIQQVLAAYTGNLGIDSRTRNYYILDGKTGQFLAGSDEEGGKTLGGTPNLFTALNGSEGYESDPTASYMDVAIPIERGENAYIIYILDNRQTVEALNADLFSLILEALVFGLVISVLLSFLLAKTMIIPIERLTDGTERVAAGDFSHIIEVESKDEIGVLTNTFNDMAKVLQETLVAVENERNKLDTLFLHMTDGVTAFARDGTMIHSNPAAQRMLHQTLDDGVDYHELFGDIVPLKTLLELKQPNYVEGERQINDRSLNVLLAPFRGESQGGIMAVLHDVTEQKKTEEMRREFVANVSHELRTPLTNIRSYAETLADTQDVPEEIRQSFLKVILNEADRMTHIVQDLLALSRFDYEKNELNLTQFSFEQTVTEVFHAVFLEGRRRNHTMTLEIAPVLPDIVADRERITQVMMNVVSNAIKYTPDGGRIRIMAGREQDKVWMEVDDNGIGIPEKDRPRIFERFYRVDKARSRESGGTGLGLSIAKEIIDQHRGSIELIDKEGPGLRVRITLWIAGADHA